ELGERGFTPITIALDKSQEDARPYIERAAPRHPALIDSEHVTADLLNIINVPTMIWIDENGRIVRPNDVRFGTDMFVALTNRPSGPFLAAVRAWVDGGAGGPSPHGGRRGPGPPAPPPPGGPGGIPPAGALPSARRTPAGR